MSNWNKPHRRGKSHLLHLNKKNRKKKDEQNNTNVSYHTANWFEQPFRQYSKQNNGASIIARQQICPTGFAHPIIEMISDILLMR